MSAPKIDGAFAVAMQHHQAGNLAAAEAIYRQILGQVPDHSDALHLLGVIAHQTGHESAAEQLIRTAIAHDPSVPRYYNNLGLVLKAQGNKEAALELFRRALALRPNYAEAHHNSGLILQMLGRSDDAKAAYQAALKIVPDYADAHINLGVIYQNEGDLDAAIDVYRRAIRLAPANSIPHNNLAYVFQAQGRHEEAIESYRAAIDLDPAYVEAHSNLAISLHCFANDKEEIHKEHIAWRQKYAEPLKPQIKPHLNDRDPDHRLRLGYVSADFRDGMGIGRFLPPLMENHRRDQFEVFCYSNLARPDATTERFRTQADHWRDIKSQSDNQVVEQIRADGIDILVDLMMHTRHNRLLVFAQKPAPVQVTYLAYCSTTGLDTIDYRITDPYLDPIGSDESCYSETSIRLPETYWCYEPPTDCPEVSDLPVESSQRLTFGCLNSFSKVSSQILNVWSRLLNALPETRLMLHSHSGGHRDRIRERFASDGIDPERLSFFGFLPRSEYFALYQQIDVALDPFPWGGGTTTCDALWMGVPVISLVGNTAVSRGGLSLVSNIGLPELAAYSEEEYLSIATRLAHDKPRLANLRATLRDRMRASPLMDAPRFALNMENAYRWMWQRWCERFNNWK